jgi:chromosome partitioning protein
LNALTAADLLIVPVQCEYYAARSLPRIIKMAKLVQAKTNPCLTYHMLVTMYDRRNKICQVIFEQMRQQMNGYLYDTIIEIDTKLKESPAFGQPITQYAPETRGAHQYRRLAQEVVDLWENKPSKNNSKACSPTSETP